MFDSFDFPVQTVSRTVPAALPDNPSDLIEMALADLRKVERSRLYTVNMATWHTPANRRCHVCLAGSVMAMTLGASPKDEVDYTEYGEEVSRKLDALNDFRRGRVGEGLLTMGFRDHPMACEFFEMPVNGYSTRTWGRRGRFHADMQMIAVHLRENGL